MLNLCYLNMIRCDDCVTSYKDAVHESLIEVLGCSTRLGGIHPPVSESVVHGESYLITGGTFAVVAIARLIIATVLLTIRVVLKTICLLVLIRCCLRWCYRLQIDRDRSRLHSNDEDIK